MSQATFFITRSTVLFIQQAVRPFLIGPSVALEQTNDKGWNHSARQP